MTVSGAPELGRPFDSDFDHFAHHRDLEEGVNDGGGGPGGGAESLDELDDVTITAPEPGQVVVFDGDGWVNDTVPAGNGIDVTGEPDGSVIVVDDETAFARSLRAVPEFAGTSLAIFAEDHRHSFYGPARLSETSFRVTQAGSLQVAPGLAILEDYGGGLGPIVALTNGVVGDAVDALFVPGDDFFDRVDSFGLYVTDWDEGTWEYRAYQGELGSAQHEIDEIVVTGSPTSGSYTLSDGIVINVDDNEATIQTAHDAQYGMGVILITGNWESFTWEYLVDNYFASAPVTVALNSLSGAPDPQITVTRLQHGGDGSPHEPTVTDGAFAVLANILVPIFAASWADTEVVNHPMQIFTPTGLDDSDLPKRFGTFLNGVVSQGSGGDDAGFSMYLNGHGRVGIGDSNVLSLIGTAASFGPYVGGAGAAGEAGQPIVVDFEEDLNSNARGAPFIGPHLTVAFGTIAGAPYSGWLRCTGGTTFEVLDTDFAPVTVALEPDDTISFAAFAFYIDND